MSSYLCDSCNYYGESDICPRCGRDIVENCTDPKHPDNWDEMMRAHEPIKEHSPLSKQMGLCPGCDRYSVDAKCYCPNCGPVYPDNWDEMMSRYINTKEVEIEKPRYVNPELESLSKQIGGDHYKNSTIQPIEVIRDWNLNFETGNAIKYIARHKLKGEPKKDIEKAIHYLEMYKETLSD